MTTKISGTDGIDVAQIRAADGDPVAIAISGAGVVSFPASPATATGSAFSAVQTSVQTLTSTPSKLLYQTELLDSDNSFDSSRFTPKVAGWYLITSRMAVDSTTLAISCRLYKNGALLRQGVYLEATGNSYPAVTLNEFVYMNGTTDYLEIYGTSVTSRATAGAAAPYYSNTFSGFFVRSS
jgi:hypothetical protein